MKAALATVADALTAHGFAAHAESRGKVLTIVNDHCPFGEAAQQFPHVVCAVDRGMIRGLDVRALRRHAIRISSRAGPTATTTASHASDVGGVSERVYLDHASSSPLATRARSTPWCPTSRDHPADPARLHADGRVTRVAVEDGARAGRRARSAPRPREVVLTSGGTEAVNARDLRGGPPDAGRDAAS